jgi:Protein of unknown function (DUF2795)
MFSKRPGSVGLAPAYWGIGRSRISWGAILAGAVTALATSLLLSLLGASLGAGWIQPFNIWTDLARLGTGAVIWQIINLALSMALGGYVAARLSGTHSHQDGELHGLTMWATAVLLGSLLFAQLVGGLAGLVGQGLGTFLGRTVGDAETAARVIAPEINLRAMADKLRQSLASSDDLTTMRREEIGSEISALVQSSLGSELSDQDFTRLVALVAAESGVTKEEAARRVTRLENDAKASRAQVAEKARVAAETAAQGAGTAARALFTGLTTGLLASLIGAWFGTRHKRALHPPHDEEREAYAPGYADRSSAHGARAYSERGGGTVRHEDAGYLASQYLRGISFPASKQDLLSLARSGHVDSRLLRAIERLPEGRYADANEVIEALDMAHAP